MTQSRGGFPGVLKFMVFIFLGALAVNGYLVLRSSMRMPQLVSDDYYENAVNFDLADGPRKAAIDDGIRMRLEREGAKFRVWVLDASGENAGLDSVGATAEFYRPSDKRLDLNTALSLSADGQSLETPSVHLVTGLWKVRVRMLSHGRLLEKTFDLFI